MWALAILHVAGVQAVSVPEFLDFTAHWLEQDCAQSNDCDGADYDGSGEVDLIDFSVVAASCDEDLDCDGLSNEDEIVHGTDPQDPDTDDDEVNDGDEVFVFLTSPTSSDSDGDGLGDGEELNANSRAPTTITTFKNGAGGDLSSVTFGAGGGTQRSMPRCRSGTMLWSMSPVPPGA